MLRQREERLLSLPTHKRRDLSTTATAAASSPAKKSRLELEVLEDGVQQMPVQYIR